MDGNNDFFLFSSNVISDNTDEKESSQQVSKGEDDQEVEELKLDEESMRQPSQSLLFAETHTPTEVDSDHPDRSPVAEPISTEANKQASSKANPKEVLYLDDYSDSKSVASNSEDDELDERDRIIEQEAEDIPPEVEDPNSLEDGEIIVPDKIEEDEDNVFDLQVAEDYFNRQNGIIVCRKCGGAGHKAADCPNVQTLTPCILCAETDHLAKDCPYNICRHCNDQGHNTKDCPHRKVPPPCIHCSSRLHSADNCPMIPRPCELSVFQHIHCLNCGQKGHVVCRQQPPMQGSTYGRCAICGGNHSYKKCSDRFGHRTIHSGEGNGSSGACFVCGKFGHIASQCPQRQERGRRSSPSQPYTEKNTSVRNGKRKNTNQGGQGNQGGYAKRIRY